MKPFTTHTNILIYMRELFKTISLVFLLTSLYFYLFLFLLKKLGVAKKVENDQKQKL